MEHLEILRNLALLEELIRCAQPLYLWEYDANATLLHTNCPTPEIVARWDCRQDIVEYGLGEETQPVMLTASAGLVWVAAFEKQEGALLRAYLIGPAFTADISTESIENIMRDAKIPIGQKNDIMNMMRQVPVTPSTTILQFALMLHYCVTGEHLATGDIHYLKTSWNQSAGARSTPVKLKHDRYRVWMAEQALLRAVREGDLNYRAVREGVRNISNGVNITLGDPLRHAKVNALTLTTQCVRAAIQGGVSPEFAYSHGDMYIQSIELSQSITDIAALNHSMYDDFVKAVHNCRTNPALSPQVQRCIDYIEAHLEQPLSLEYLAEIEGYTKYYLSRLFRKEMGVSIADYIKYARVERAKVLLTCTELPIQEISDKLQFCARSYFSDTFSKVTGISPAEYRLAPPPL